MEDDQGKSVADSGPSQYKFTAIKSADYRLEFINGALSNATPRGEIVCNFYFESRDMPMEQMAIADDNASGEAKLAPFQDPRTYTRDVKFGIIINVPFAKDLVIMLNKKIIECEAAAEDRANKGDLK